MTTDHETLREQLREHRRDCARTLLGLYKQANAGHIGSSLSCLEILVDLCFGRMRAEDQLILSKGHAAAALYTVLSKSGRLPEADLSSFYKEGTFLAAHPPVGGRFASIPFGTGSLGHGLSIASGIAMSTRFTDRQFDVYCVLSDGECNEGSTWEAALFASQQKLTNLTIIIDANGLQGFGTTSTVMNLEPLAAKWRDFGFSVTEASNGNSFDELAAAHRSLVDAGDSKPKCLLARTTKGHGVSYMSGKMEWHYLPMSDEQYAVALAENDQLAASRSEDAPKHRRGGSNA